MARRLRIAVYGACHGEALRTVLSAWPGVGEQVTFIDLPHCTAITAEQADRFCRDEAPSLDLLLFQPVSEVARGDEFAAQRFVDATGPSCTAVSFQYLHWEGYAPFVSYPADGMEPFEELQYLDYQIVRAFLDGRSPRSATRWLRTFDLGADGVATVIDASLRELRARERPQGLRVDVVVTDEVERLHLGERLFHTVNHPGATVMALLGRGVVEHLVRHGFLAPPDREPAHVDPLAGAMLPVSRAMSRHAGFAFPADRRHHTRTTSLRPRRLVDLHYRYLAGQDRAATERAFASRAGPRPWYAALG